MIKEDQQNDCRHQEGKQQSSNVDVGKNTLIGCDLPSIMHQRKRDKKMLEVKVQPNKRYCDVVVKISLSDSDDIFRHVAASSTLRFT